MKVMEPTLSRLKLPLTRNAPGAVAGVIAFKAQVSLHVEDVHVLAAVNGSEIAVVIGGLVTGVRRLFLKITSPVTPFIVMPPPVPSWPSTVPA